MAGIDVASEFEFTKTDDGFTFTCPASWYQEDVLSGVLTRSRASEHVELGSLDGRWNLTFQSRSPDWEDHVARLFASMHGLPTPDAALLHHFRNHAAPLLSCVILLTANDLFVRRTLIPSIVACTPGAPLEIIVVYNGHGCDLSVFGDVRVVHSTFGSVPQGYNTGAATARGEYVAWFHDDCCLDDDRWFERAIAALTAGASAVTPEMQVVSRSGVRIAKNVPLVMARKAFRHAGGYDTKYFAGLEDLDFTYTLLGAGHRLESLDVRSHHFDGMSTTIMLHARPRQLKHLYALNMIPKGAVAEVKRALFERLGPEINLVTARNVVRFCEKHGTYLAAHGHDDFLERGRQLSQVVREHRAHPLIKGDAGLVALYRSRLNW